MHSDQEFGTNKQIEIPDRQFVVFLQNQDFQDDKKIVVLDLRLGALSQTTSVLDMQRMQLIPLGRFIQFGAVRVCYIVPFHRTNSNSGSSDLDLLLGRDSGEPVERCLLSESHAKSITYDLREFLDSWRRRLGQ